MADPSFGSSSWRSREETRSDKFIYELPYSVLSDVSVILDVNEKWKELGGTYLGFTILDLLRIQQMSRHNDTSSYTMTMLLEWSQQNHTVTELFQFLSRMKLFQAMSLLKEHVSPRYHHLLLIEGGGSSSSSSSSSLPFSNGAPGFMGMGPMESGASSWNGAGVFTSGLPKPPLPFEQQQGAIKQKQIPVQDTAYDIGSYPEFGYQSVRPGQQQQQQPRQMWPTQHGTTSYDAQLDYQYKKMYIDPHNLNRPDSNEAQVLYSKVSPNLMNVSSANVARAGWCSPQSHLFAKSGGQRLPPPPLPSHGAYAVESIEDNTQMPSRLSYEPKPMHEGQRDRRNGEEEEARCLTSSKSMRKSETSEVSTVVGQIPYSDIVDATNNFSNRVLGRGGFGVVYEGCWKKLKVAIKHIVKKENPGLTSLEEAKLRQSYVELKTLNQCRYDNILPLYGYAVHEDGLCLMYQFMVNGSLEDRLLRRGGTPPLTWKQRFVIARGSARGIQYLHTCDPRIIHGDIKSANILLDVNFEPKIGDFGLAREGPTSQCTHTMVSAVHGTQPYLPPDFLRSRQLSTKVDTYSFGVVLFELATGLRAYDEERPKKRNLRDYVVEYDSTKYESLRDLSAGEDYGDAFLVLIHEGRRCASSKNKERPEMSDVFEDLDSKLQAMETRTKTVNVSEPIDASTGRLETRDHSPVSEDVPNVFHANIGGEHTEEEAVLSRYVEANEEDSVGGATLEDPVNIPCLTALGTKLPST